MTPHDTLLKFDYPESLVARYEHWAVLLRPQQATLGSLVIASIADIRRLSEMPPDSFVELHQVVGQCEAALRRLFSYDKINYLMLMMVDLQVHAHVIPRYSSEREFAGKQHGDTGWPGPPDLSTSINVSLEDRQLLLESLKGTWSLREQPENATLA